MNCYRRSDRTLRLCIQSGRDPASGRLKENQAILTGPCLRPVMDHQTRPVAILEELDLSGIDRTLGGSVRSLPPERPISRSHAASRLFFGFLSCHIGGPHLSHGRRVFFLDLTTPPQLLCPSHPCRRSSPRRRSPVPDSVARHRICQPCAQLHPPGSLATAPPEPSPQPSVTSSPPLAPSATQGC